jgi:outer membrane protein OmpA-like peptidoglycan-associated protein
MTRRTRMTTAVAALLAFGTVGLSGCAQLGRMTQTERGAVIGATTGAAVGAAVGRGQGGTAAGAILGAVVGGAAGAAIGRQMDRQAEALERDLEYAEVERIGEGIRVTFPSGILFDFDSFALRSQARANLSNLAQSLQQYPGSSVLIVGHTDNVGSDAYNQRLSQQRADAAANYLSSQGIGRDRIRTMGMSFHEPIASNATAEGRQQNRRVEVAIFASPEYQDQIRRQYGN